MKLVQEAYTLTFQLRGASACSCCGAKNADNEFDSLQQVLPLTRQLYFNDHDIANMRMAVTLMYLLLPRTASVPLPSPGATLVRTGQPPSASMSAWTIELNVWSRYTDLLQVVEEHANHPIRSKLLTDPNVTVIDAFGEVVRSNDPVGDCETLYVLDANNHQSTWQHLQQQLPGDKDRELTRFASRRNRVPVWNDSSEVMRVHCHTPTASNASRNDAPLRSSYVLYPNLCISLNTSDEAWFESTSCRHQELSLYTPQLLKITDRRFSWWSVSLSRRPTRSTSL